MCLRHRYRIPYSRVPPHDRAIHRGRIQCGTDSHRRVLAVIPDRLL